jgi:tellurite resistance protein
MAGGLLDDYGRKLIDALFHEQDQKLLQAFRERLEETDRRAQLAHICGFDDEALLNHLLELDVTPEAVAALAVVPLVAVAWADRTVQAEEREAILKSARECGIPPKDERYPILEHWLTEHPGSEVLEAWKHYTAALCRQLNPKEIEELKHDLLDRARDVAQAAGGVLGLGGKISAKERAVLAELEQAFA